MSVHTLNEEYLTFIKCIMVSINYSTVSSQGFRLEAKKELVVLMSLCI